MNHKPTLRRTLKAQLHAMTAAQRAEASREMCARLAAWWNGAAARWSGRPVAVYQALRDEPDLKDFIAQLSRDCCIVAPRLGSQPNDARPLQTLFGGEAEIALLEIGLWLVPGLAFDAQGFRLGRGGGWYDRVLSRVAPDALVVGVCFELQIVPEVPREAHDVRVHGVMTEARLFFCDGD